MTYEKNFAELAYSRPELFEDYIREFLSYEMICKHSCEFIRREDNTLWFKREPSSLYWSRQIEWPWAIYHAELNSKGHALDIGSGWSVLKYGIASRYEKVICLDNNRESLSKANETTIRLGFNNIRQVLGDVRNLPFPNDSFDCVFCISVLEHIKENHINCLHEIHRVLKLGGVALLSIDVVLKGFQSEEYYLHYEHIPNLLKTWDITEICVHPKYRIGRGKDGMETVVLLIHYRKQFV